MKSHVSIVTEPVAGGGRGDGGGGNGGGGASGGAPSPLHVTVWIMSQPPLPLQQGLHTLSSLLMAQHVSSVYVVVTQLIAYECPASRQNHVAWFWSVYELPYSVLCSKQPL